MPIVLATAFLCASPMVHDGDTIRCGGERIRIANIDAPELPDSPKCQDRRRSYAWCDNSKGYQAREAVLMPVLAALNRVADQLLWDCPDLNEDRLRHYQPDPYQHLKQSPTKSGQAERKPH